MMSNKDASFVPYRGYWEEPLDGQKWYMRVEMILSPDLSGVGEDIVGNFSVRGSVVEQNVCFIKSYASHNVYYSGTLCGNAINGTWHIPGDRGGRFRLWRSAASAADADSADDALTRDIEAAKEIQGIGLGGGGHHSPNDPGER
jgi:hypothetical protein